MKSDNKKVWFITGASKGFGLILVRQLLEAGHSVTATTRNKADLVKEIPTSSDFLALEMDLVDEKSVQNAISETVKTFGRIDNVVNNAGYGLLGALEELSDAEARQNFDVNVFGSLNVIRQALPYLREQKSGHIFNFSSIGGYVGDFPGFGIYCSTKFAVIGFTEGLAIETKPFGIKVTAVLPGYFRTNFLNPDSLATPKNHIEDYNEVRASQTMHQDEINQNQPGDPEKGVAEIIKIAEQENPPLHLFLGNDAYEMAKSKISAMETELEEWKLVTISTGF
ncbi:NAD(P)-dependent dehydrogenase (short-subunit alcohol dehydrogenase family) [Flavobacterium arsenatis]|uniref:NAD(P)-dependent dehydrogenase (Short-subunit alcohol dehydrogenase family) n=1 Tax=Flavobacterium arsenatis TaxID=1484332 RepID=A0ABU1TJI3_9FLAO|nr:SDR family NAD(P)-dependent oxidoreductase [Flavobacterium arsenatis]MDR6966018.1 NAD(P)-dependent dehydrogenase (short-subunit alcohol dehydrogenase family) [Flavobacterium arsenatis]